MSNSVLAITLRKPVIPFKPNIPIWNYQKITLSETVNVGTLANPDHQKKKEEVFYCDGQDIEYIIRTVDEFKDVCTASRLSITNGPTKFAASRRCLGNDVRDNWDAKRTDHPQTINGFTAAVTDLLTVYLTADSLQDQQLYLQLVKKPKFMTVRASAARIKIINKFMGYFPGANRVAPFDANRLKHILFNIMPIPYQRAFGQAAQRLDADAYTYDNLIEYMVQQESVEQADARSRIISNIGNNRCSATTAFGFQDNNFVLPNAAA